MAKSRWTFVNGPYSMTTNQKYTVDSKDAPGGYSLADANPRAVGDWVWVEDFTNFWSINPVSLTSIHQFENGHLVRETSPLILDVSGASVSLIWTGSLWKIFNNRGS